MTRAGLLALLISSAVGSSVACVDLTAPPSPEPIATESTTAASAAPKASATAPATASAAPVPTAAPPPTNEKVVQVDLAPGKGDRAVQTGDTISVNYVGKLPDGKEFDSTAKHGKPFDFTVGRGVIPGWSQGVVGMKVGGKRKLTIPPSLAYGERGVPGAIPPNSTLTFEIELLSFK